MTDTRHNPYDKTSIYKCFKCNQPGHISSDCPLRKTHNIVEEREHHSVYLDNDEDEGQSNEVDYSLGDEVEKFACIVQRILLSPKESKS